MSSDAIYEKLAPVFQDIFEDDNLAPAPEMTAQDVEEWDSLNHIRLIVAIEELFNIKFSSAEIGSLQKVDDIVNVINSKN